LHHVNLRISICYAEKIGEESLCLFHYRLEEGTDEFENELRQDRGVVGGIEVRISETGIRQESQVVQDLI
jgi:hypothetical protein